MPSLSKNTLQLLSFETTIISFKTQLKNSIPRFWQIFLLLSLSALFLNILSFSFEHFCETNVFMENPTISFLTIFALSFAVTFLFNLSFEKIYAHQHNSNCALINSYSKRLNLKLHNV